MQHAYAYVRENVARVRAVNISHDTNRPHGARAGYVFDVTLFSLEHPAMVAAAFWKMCVYFQISLACKLLAPSLIVLTSFTLACLWRCISTVVRICLHMSEQVAGTDATSNFRDIGHSMAAEEHLPTHVVGRLKKGQQ